MLKSSVFRIRKQQRETTNHEREISKQREISK